jgi:hypothetical protein
MCENGVWGAHCFRVTAVGSFTPALEPDSLVGTHSLRGEAFQARG